MVHRLERHATVEGESLADDVAGFGLVDGAAGGRELVHPGDEVMVPDPEAGLSVDLQPDGGADGQVGGERRGTRGGVLAADGRGLAGREVAAGGAALLTGALLGEGRVGAAPDGWGGTHWASIGFCARVSRDGAIITSIPAMTATMATTTTAQVAITQRCSRSGSAYEGAARRTPGKVTPPAFRTMWAWTGR